MAHLGRGEYALLLQLSRNGRQSVAVEGNRTLVGDEANFRSAMVEVLVDSGFVTRVESDGGAPEIELSAAGRGVLDDALAQKWVVDHSGLHEESHTYRFEVPDSVTGNRFVVAVSQDAGPTIAHRVAYSVIGAPSVRDSCRKIETLGPEGGFAIKVAIEGAGEVNVWRKL